MLALLSVIAVTIQQPRSSLPDTAVLVIGNRAIAVFRAPLGAAAPAERAAAASRRFEAALHAGDDSIASQGGPEGVLLLIGGRPIFTLTPADVDTVGGQTLNQVLVTAHQRLAVAIVEANEARSLAPLLVGVALALAATATLALVLRLLFIGRRRMASQLRVATAAAIPGISIRGFTLLRPEQVRIATRAMVTGLAWVLGIVTGYLYLTFLLTRFPWTRAWGEALGRYLIATLVSLGMGALRAVPGLFTVGVIFLATRFLARLLRTVFDAVERGAVILPGIHPETARPTRRIVVALLWLFALVVAYPHVPGSDSVAFKGVSVFTGLLVTLGSAGLVGQAMSGLVLMYSRAFKEGDFIQVGDIQGTVVSLSLLSTRLRTPKNEYVTVPNGVVVTGAATNYSAPQAHRESLMIYSSVTIGYDTAWRRVHELLIAAATQTERVLGDPAPFVLQRALNDWYVEYQVNAAIDPAHAAEMPVMYSALHANIQDTFWKAGVEIMSPTYLALRDGNTLTIPEDQRPKRRSPAFRVSVNPGE